MGCVASRTDKQERVRICKERKRLMKELLVYRKEFADAQLSYLRSLRNTGVTLRQFTDSESLEFEETTSGLGFPPSPPPPLPPSPPPPPSFSPDLRKFTGSKPPPQGQSSVEDIIEINEDGGETPPPPLPSSSWEYWDPFNSSLHQCESSSSSNETGEERGVDVADEENWEDTNTEFLEEEEDDDDDDGDDEDNESIDDDENRIEGNQHVVQFVDEGILSTMSCGTKDDASSDMAVVIWKCKNLTGIVKELDEYFLKASDVLKDVVVIVDVDAKGTFHYQNIYEQNRKRSNSSKVFSALTWNWSSKSLQSAKETGDFLGSGEPCKPGAHGITLHNLYLEEKKLYKDVKEEENSKLEYARKSLLLRRQEEDHDLAKTEKTRLAVETLESYISSLQESISKSNSNILNLINKELHPQTITLASGLLHMWQTMHHCHQFQNRISQQLKNLTDQQSFEPTTEYRRQAAAQLQNEVNSWHRSFCKLVRFQGDYVRVICKWIELTNSLKDYDPAQNVSLMTLHSLTQKWLQALDNLPDKMVSDAIKLLLSAVQAIVLQQQDEWSVRKRSEKLGRKLERELSSLSEVEVKYDAKGVSLKNTDSQSTSSKHPLTARRAKVEALQRLANEEKAKYATSVKTTKALILNNLQSSLPRLFQALMAYSSAYANSFEAIVSSVMKPEDEDVDRT